MFTSFQSRLTHFLTTSKKRIPYFRPISNDKITHSPTPTSTQQDRRMSTQRAIITQGAGDAQIVSDAPVPKLTDNNLLVKTLAVALNPTDTLHIDYLPVKGVLPGCDFAGIVEEVGKAVTKDFKVGDRVAGFSHGSNALNHDDGTFAEHITAKAHVCMKIPDNLSIEEAATLGVGITTVGQGLYQSLGLPYPTEPTKAKTHVLIYGGSTATGTLAIQYAKLSGLEVSTTASPHNFDLLKSLGADHVFDYNSPTCSADIRAVTDNTLGYVFDCHSTGESPRICAGAMGSKGGKYSSLIPVENLPREDVSNALTVAFTAIGEKFKFGEHEFPGNADDAKFAGKFWDLAEELLKQGKLKVHPPSVREDGLEGVLKGLQDLREKKVSGVKLVYKM